MSITGEPEGEPQKVDIVLNLSAPDLLSVQSRSEHEIEGALFADPHAFDVDGVHRLGCRWLTSSLACTPQLASWRPSAMPKPRARASTSTSLS